MSEGRPASVLRLVLQLGRRLLAAWLFVLHVTHASADAPAEPSADQCIAFHVEGQAERVAGHFTAAAELFKACLQPACSPVLRADCATQLASVEDATPSLVLAATADGPDLMDAGKADRLAPGWSSRAARSRAP